MQLKALLLDLDGTLVDTAPDMVATLNRLLQQHGKPAVDSKRASKLVSRGANAMLQFGFGDTLDDKTLSDLRQQFLDSYEQHICLESEIYDGMNDVLEFCEQRNIRWGIVSNKPYYLAEKLLTQLNLFDRSSITLGGDSLPQAKPHPMPLLHCCLTLNLAASECLYVGDDERDIISSNAAGMDSAVAQWGYIQSLEQSEKWNADYLLSKPNGLLTLLKERLSN